MPELPEVETTCRGIAPHILGQSVQDVLVRNSRLRYSVPNELKRDLVGQRIKSVSRRGKYLLLGTDVGTVIIHLGMSGSLRIVLPSLTPDKHDHVDIVVSDECCLRLHDPRRFGAVLWTQDKPEQHKLLAKLGPEPLTDVFDSNYLFRQSRGKKKAIKLMLMDNHIVVGVGNIYANEALFLAGIRPRIATGSISRQRYSELVEAIKQVLNDAIKQGGTTLKDFVDGSGNPGYFQQQLQVYGRGGEACYRCGGVIKELKLGQRATYYCGGCQ